MGYGGEAHGPTTSRDSSTTLPVSNWAWFDNCTLYTLGEAAVAGYGLGRSFGFIPGRVLIFCWYFILPNDCTFLPAAERLSVLPTGPFLGVCARGGEVCPR